MRRLSYWLTGLLVLLLGGLLGFWLLMPPALHYHLIGDEASFNAVLSRQVVAGDSMETVTRLLGPGIGVSEAQRVRLVKSVAEFQRQVPESRPDGVKQDDQFLGYEVSGMTIYLQFRDSRLVNFRPEDFETPAEVMSTGS